MLRIRPLRLPFAALAFALPLLSPAPADASAAAATDASDAQPVAWKAGFARRDITPREPLFLAGYAARNRPFDHVAAPLFVKALALEDAGGRQAVLVTCDVIGFKQAAADAIYERLQAGSRLHRKDILLNASHIHTGPSLLLDPAERSDSMTPAQAEQQVAWTRRLIDLTVEAALEALDNLKPARLSYGVGVAPFVMNRREWTPAGVRLGFNPSGYADRSVPVLRIDAPGGTLRGVLFGAAVHNTTLTQDHDFVSPDFAGYAQARIEQQHPAAQAMFITGCAGSANPHPRGTLEDAEQHGETLAAEVCRVLDARLVPLAGPLDTRFASTELPLAEPPTRERIDEILSARRGGWEPQTARAMLRLLESGQPLPATRDYAIAVWRFGDDLTLIGLSGEVVGEYVPLLHATLGPGRLWISAYCHDVFGYVPTAQVLKEGGYETRGTYSGPPGAFSPETESHLLQAVQKLATGGRRSDP